MRVVAFVVVFSLFGCAEPSPLQIEARVFGDNYCKVDVRRTSFNFLNSSSKAFLWLGCNYPEEHQFVSRMFRVGAFVDEAVVNLRVQENDGLYRVRYCADQFQIESDVLELNKLLKPQDFSFRLEDDQSLC